MIPAGSMSLSPLHLCKVLSVNTAFLCGNKDNTSEENELLLSAIDVVGGPKVREEDETVDGEGETRVS